MKKIISAILLCLAISALNGREVTGQVINIENGYCFTLLADDGHQYNIRLYGMYGPKPGQPLGKDAKDYLNLLINGQEVKVNFTQKTAMDDI